MFSPYYAWARRRGGGDPLHHCALNVALYGSGRKRWALTERGRAAVWREPGALTIGPSALAWEGDALTVRLDEIAVPVPGRIRGTVRLEPAGFSGHAAVLDRAERHWWWPVAPRARVEVALEQPALRWAGPAYHDANAGDEPLERAFAGWDWSRADLGEGAAVLYDVTGRDGERRGLALHFDRAGCARAIDPPPRVPLARSGWRIARTTRSDAGQPASILRTLEDTPFYARSLISARLLGEPITAVHESLSLDRFQAPWVQLMLPFRMPRAWR